MKAWLAPQKLILLWIIGFTGSFVIQSIGEAWFASATLWGRNVGWQTEIAIWNLGVIAILIPISRSKDFSRQALPGLILLSTAFAVNHLQALLRADTFEFGNCAGFLTNALAVLLGATCLFKFRQS